MKSWRSFRNSGDSVRLLGIFFLVLCLVAPLAAFACECCPGAEAISSHPVVQKGGQDCCCPLLIGPDREGCNIQKKDKFLTAAPFQFFVPQTSAVGANLLIHRPFEIDFYHSHSDPPLIFFQTPLYLTHQILRL